MGRSPRQHSGPCSAFLLRWDGVSAASDGSEQGEVAGLVPPGQTPLPGPNLQVLTSSPNTRVLLGRAHKQNPWRDLSPSFLPRSRLCSRAALRTVAKGKISRGRSPSPPLPGQYTCPGGGPERGEGQSLPPTMGGAHPTDSCLLAEAPWGWQVAPIIPTTYPRCWLCCGQEVSQEPGTCRLRPCQGEMAPPNQKGRDQLVSPGRGSLGLLESWPWGLQPPLRPHCPAPSLEEGHPLTVRWDPSLAWPPGQGWALGAAETLRPSVAGRHAGSSCGTMALCLACPAPRPRRPQPQAGLRGWGLALPPARLCPQVGGGFCHHSQVRPSVPGEPASPGPPLPAAMATSAPSSWAGPEPLSGPPASPAVLAPSAAAARRTGWCGRVCCGGSPLLSPASRTRVLSPRRRPEGPGPAPWSPLTAHILTGPLHRAGVDGGSHSCRGRSDQ